MTRQLFSTNGQDWAVGYDPHAATYFLDRDSDLERDDYFPPDMPTFNDLMRSPNASVIPKELLAELRNQDPRSSAAAQAAAVSRTDQAAASFRDVTGGDHRAQMIPPDTLAAQRASFPAIPAAGITARSPSAQPTRPSNSPTPGVER